MLAAGDVTSYKQYTHFIAERISARQYKSGSILGIYVRMYVRTFGHLRRRALHVQGEEKRNFIREQYVT